MIAISQHLRNYGFTTDQDAHTRPPGIWKKLRTLYNLEALDKIVYNPTPNTESSGSTKQSYPGRHIDARLPQGRPVLKRALLRL